MAVRFVPGWNVFVNTTQSEKTALVPGGGFVSFAGDLAAQTLRPDADVTTTNWLPSTGGTLYTMIDETVADDADYIYTETLNAECEISLSSGSTPVDGSRNLLVRTPAGFTPSGGITVTLRQGSGTEVQSFTTSVVAANTTYTYSVTQGISDYSDLRVRIKAIA